MLALMLLATMWLPYFATRWWKSRTPQVISIIGYKKDNSHEEITAEEVCADYTHIEVRYTYGGETWVYASLPRDFAWPHKVHRGTNTDGEITSAILTTETGIPEDVTDEVREYAGPRGDFHDVDFDFNWIFGKDKSAVKELKMITKKGKHVDIDVAKNEERTQTGMKTVIRGSEEYEYMPKWSLIRRLMS